MTLSVRLLALWLAALWLPMTMHCQLASVRLCCSLGACCEVGACGKDQTACNDPFCCGETPDCPGVCKIVEDGNYFPKQSWVTVPVAAGELIAPPFALDRQLPLPPVATLSEATGAPPGWIRVWQFVFRAAVAPRAPSAVC